MVAERQIEHVSTSDIMYPDWDRLTAVDLLETAESRAVETDKNVSETVASEVAVSQNIPSETDLSKCLWCGKPFHGRTNKRFCTPSMERGLNFKRRAALSVAVAEHFKQRGCSVRTGTLQNVAKKCIDADYEWWLGAMQKIGWNYNAKSCQWVIKGS